MKVPPRPLSQKRAAEWLLGRVRRARLYVLSQAAGAAALYAPSSLDHEPPEGDSWNPFRRVPPVTFFTGFSEKVRVEPLPPLAQQLSESKADV
jgi:hypothetical protein